MPEHEIIQQSEYLSLLRWALHTGSPGYSVNDALSATARDAPDEGVIFRKLIAGVLFSREFILSYQVVLLCLLSFFTLPHGISRLRSWRRARQRQASGQGGETKSGRSSSSSTLNANDGTSETLSKLDEQSPLLPAGGHRRTSYSNPGYTLRAFLVYQPSPIPVINKSLPSNGCTLVILMFLSLQIFYTFYNVQLSVPMLFVFADRTSLVFVANLPLLYLFAAKNQPVKYLTGHSYETLNILHRRLGEVMCLLALLHGLGMLGVWYTILRPGGSTLASFVLSKIILLGLLALIAYETIYFTSLSSFRQRWYELFLGLHVVLQIVALALLFFHHRGSRPYVAAALAIFLVDRLVFRMSLKSYTTDASLEIKDDRSTVSVQASIPLQSPSGLLRWLISRPGITGGWNSTDHVFLSVPSLARKHWIQAHPFTIASRAPSPGQSAVNLDLIIRAHDGFSQDLLQYTKTHARTEVRLDGPYGSQSAVRMLRDSYLAVVVAGGSGIAVGWPLVWSVLNSRRMTDAELPIEAALPKKILFIWVVRQKSHTSWVRQEEMQLLRNSGVDVMIPPPTEAYGHPNINGYVTDWIVARDTGFNRWPQNVGIVCSGPDGMNRSVRNLASTLILDGHNISVEIEKFGW